MTSRAARVQRAKQLRVEGLTTREIAERMGVARSTVDAYLNDPDLSKQRVRRERYARPCELCGAPTDGSGGYAVQRRHCIECLTWSEEAILEAMRRWALEHGGIPPTTLEWVRAGEDHPASSAVCRRFNWNALLLKAGFALKCDRRPETQQWVIEQVKAGTPVAEIADAMGVTPGAIYERLHSKHNGRAPVFIADLRAERAA